METSAGDVAVLRVEIAEDEAQRRLGLMMRDSLAYDAGMLFLFDETQPAGSGFWMHRTRIPLSVAFLAADGTILRILDMEPCTRRLSIFCRRYLSPDPYDAALEVNRGWFEANRVRVEDRVLLPLTAGSSAPARRSATAAAAPGR